MNRIEEIKQLEADSELLAGLIEMLFTFNYDFLFCNYGFSFNVIDSKEEILDASGSTPREAIEAAVRKFKEEI